MIIEMVTLSTTPQTIRDLLIAKGRTDIDIKTNGISSISMRIDEESTATVYASDPDSIDSVPVLKPASSQPYESHMESNLYQTLLHASDAGTEIGLVISY